MTGMLTAVGLAVLMTAPLAPEDEDGLSADRETQIVRLRHVPAADTAETVQAWVDSEEQATQRPGATVVAAVVSNSLIITGSVEQLADLVEVARGLDVPPAQIRVKAALLELSWTDAPPTGTADWLGDEKTASIAQIIDQLRQRAELRVLAQPELLVVDNQPGFVQLGSRVPKVTGVTSSSRGRSNQVQLENVGDILGVTGRISEENMVTVEIDVERSYLGAEKEGTPIASTEDGTVLRSPQLYTLKLQSTVSLRDGETVLLGGMVSRDQERWREALLLLRAEIVR